MSRIDSQRMGGPRQQREPHHPIALAPFADPLQFKELNSQLNREVAEFERASIEGTHTLSGDLRGHFPSASSELEAEAQAYILGGSSASPAADSQEERRRRILEATMNRLRKEEEEIEHSCGTRGTA